VHHRTLAITAETADMSEALAFWVTAPGRGELRTEALPPAGDGEVVVRALYSGVSRGTESLVFAGRVPASEYARMRAPFQAGEFPAPVKYGYSNVGVVEQGPSDLAGRTVFCLFPHQTRYVVPAAALHPLPPGVPAARAVLAANLETAINGLWDALPRIGERIAVVGAGTVGCLVAWLAARIPGCEVELIDIAPAREAVARALGVPFALPSRATPDADRVIHASGAPEGLVTALALAGSEATVVELSWYGDREVRLPLGGAFHARRLTLRSSQVGSLPPAELPRWTYRRRMALALRLLADERLDVLISGESAFADLPTTLPALATGDALCHRIRYD
jgi:NADPH:quinone reductase-like Zn-dependent oxidoreductase